MTAFMDYIKEDKIDLAQVIQVAHHPKAGAVVIFSGEARNHHEGQSVEFLEYEAHVLLAEESIKEILEEAKTKWQLHVAFAQHRVGRVEISETAVVVVTSSSHRKEAYEANQYIIDRIKSEAPIWKKEFFVSGENVWR